MTIKLKAVMTFEGIEGFVRKGQVFEVSSQERADKLVKTLKFAEHVDQDTAVDQEKPLKDYTVKELKEKAKDLHIDGYSGLVKDELISAIEEKAFTNGKEQTEETNGDPAQVQDVVNFENDKTEEDSE